MSNPILQISVSGHPRPQPRHRAINGVMVAVISPKVKRWQADVVRATQQAISAYGETFSASPFADPKAPLFMKVLFRMPHDKPAKWGKLHDKSNGADLDNLEKLVMDEILGRKGSPLPGNDSRICHKEGLKVWSSPAEAGCVITLQGADAETAVRRFMRY